MRAANLAMLASVFPSAETVAGGACEVEQPAMLNSIQTITNLKLIAVLIKNRVTILHGSENCNRSELLSSVVSVQ